MWVWLKRSGGEGSEQAGGLEPWAGPSDSGGGCTLMALGALGRWRRTQCAGHFHFLCESLVTGEAQQRDISSLIFKYGGHNTWYNLVMM